MWQWELRYVWTRNNNTWAINISGSPSLAAMFQITANDPSITHVSRAWCAASKTSFNFCNEGNDKNFWTFELKPAITFAKRDRAAMEELGDVEAASRHRMKTSASSPLRQNPNAASKSKLPVQTSVSWTTRRRLFWELLCGMLWISQMGTHYAG